MRYFFEIQYDGTNYHGWQYQPNAVSVQATIENELHKLFKGKNGIIGCGRTDTGVHATQYYFHYDIEDAIDTSIIKYKLNGMLPKDIFVRAIEKVDSKAHARFDAEKRSYTYIICLRKNPFAVNRAWINSYDKLNIDIMQQAALDILQYNDFPMLCKAGSDVKHFKCQLFSSNLSYQPDKEQLVYRITANRFLRNMIRRLVGLLVQVGKTHISIEEYNYNFKQKQQLKYINLAPPEGLYLSRVEYPFIKRANIIAETLL